MTISEAVRGFLVDMDGTLYLSDVLLPGARAFLEQIPVPVLLLTNNSSKNRDGYVQKFAGLGLEVSPEQIFTSGEATARYLQQRAPGAAVALFGTPALEADFRAQGLRLEKQQPDYVVLGFDTTLTYASMTLLCNLVRAGLPYIATHPDYNCPTDAGFIPDIGAIIAFVEASTGRRPDLIVGKPNRPILEMAVAKLGLPLEQVCMVGDRLYTDIAMGQTAPIQTALVLSGETKAADLENSPYQPDYCFEDIGALLRAWQEGR